MTRRIDLRFIAGGVSIALAACSTPPSPVPASARSTTAAPRSSQPIVAVAPEVGSAAPAPQTRSPIPACPNYARQVDIPYPKAAFEKGLTDGLVRVTFRVDGPNVEILKLNASDPTFGDAAVALVRGLGCNVTPAKVFEVPFSFHLEDGPPPPAKP